MAFRIPFNRPSFEGSELSYIAKAIENGHTSGDGVFTAKCSKLLESELQCAKVLLTTSCTHALEMAAILLDIEPGDEVLIPTYTFVSTVNAFVLRGAKPVFIDIRPDTLNIDEEQIERNLTPRTRAIVPVHYAGVGCEMDRIMQLAKQHRIAVVEDNAHGLFGTYKGTKLGTLGELATLSFHETKNIICGEGGALLINNPDYIERAEIIREKGTNRSKFFRGQVDKYTWVDEGSSYLPSELLAAFLLAQLEARESIQQQRKRLWHGYWEGLNSWARTHGVQLPTIPPHCEQPYHMFYIILPSLQVRQDLIAHLRERGILSVFHYLPLHISPMGKRFGGQEGQCPVAENLSDRVLRLPFFNHLSTSDQQEVIERICSFSF